MFLIRTHNNVWSLKQQKEPLLPSWFFKTSKCGWSFELMGIFTATPIFETNFKTSTEITWLLQSMKFLQFAKSTNNYCIMQVFQASANMKSWICSENFRRINWKKANDSAIMVLARFNYLDKHYLIAWLQVHRISNQGKEKLSFYEEVLIFLGTRFTTAPYSLHFGLQISL